MTVNLADQIQVLRNQKVPLLDLNLYMGEIGTHLNLPAL
jgi:hypothetical protein